MNYILKWILLVIAFIVLAVLCSNGQERVQLNPPAGTDASDKLVIPAGYEFVDAAAYGTTENIIYFLEDKNTGKIFKSDGKNIGNEVVVPAGYKFAGASAYGSSSCEMSYYLRADSDGSVYKMKQ